jgi:hypothetical protein
MPRQKKHATPYTGDKKQMEAAFQEYLSCVADCFGKPYDDRECMNMECGNRESRESQIGENTSLRAVCEEFHISIPKARKLLITAGIYSTEKSRMVAELTDQGKSVAEIMTRTGLSRSSVSSYLPYQKFSYNMEETSRHAEDSRKYRERKKCVGELHAGIKMGITAEGECVSGGEGADAVDHLLWQTVIAYQNYPFHTSSGLPFSYTVKQGKNGAHTGELIVSRKEESKTLARSSVMLAFHKVLGEITVVDVSNTDCEPTVLVPAEFKGPKAIGQIFGISYIYSMFWKWGLIRVPGKVEEKLLGKRK